ncbi:alpha/beta fold hydrolase [Streptomyces sp. NPDC126933]|uniref:alpha/beta fold hydrolase n=1 Tax=unclassified Streptomyces TaxID=2593676 RepID=UPI00365FE9B6
MTTLEDTCDFSLALHDLGGHGPDLLFCHTTGMHTAMWNPLAGLLARDFHCWAIGFRGHGDSGRPPGGDLHRNRLRDDLLTVLHGSGSQRPYGFGYFIGGTALVLTEAHTAGSFLGTDLL